MHRNSCGRAREAWGGIPKVEDRKEVGTEGRKKKEARKQKQNKTLAWLGPLPCAGLTYECGEGEEGSMNPLYRHRN